MRSFGKAVGGGRRRASREALPMAALVSRVEPRQVAVLVDFSMTGARLRGSGLPPVGEPVSVRIDCVRAYGTVAWAEDDLCGVAFDAPLPRFEIERLKRDARSATLSFGSTDARVAVDDWVNGLTQ